MSHYLKACHSFGYAQDKSEEQSDEESLKTLFARHVTGDSSYNALWVLRYARSRKA